jgi:hypothetical protein
MEKLLVVRAFLPALPEEEILKLRIGWGATYLDVPYNSYKRCGTLLWGM